jgi:hypothetical protein
MQSKILAHQIMKLFNKDGQHTLDIEKDLFTWTSVDGHQLEYNGTLCVALILSQIKHHCHVDIWAEIKRSRI